MELTAEGWKLTMAEAVMDKVISLEEAQDLYQDLMNNPDQPTPEHLEEASSRLHLWLTPEELMFHA